MFTVGIFSTHLPYLAFVLFYAFFFLVGIPKASAGDLSNEERFIKTEIPAVTDFQFSEKNGYAGQFDSYFDLRQPNDFEITSYKKLKFLSFHLKQIRQNCCIFAHFSRPPPLF
jgi:hypothetical protein